MNKDIAFSVIVSALSNMYNVLDSETDEPMSSQLLRIFKSVAEYDIFLSAVRKIGLNNTREIVADISNANMHLCLIITLFYALNDDKDRDKIYLRAKIELLQEAFETMTADEFLSEANKTQ